MPRNDKKEEKEFEENNKPQETQMRIISDSELINLKLDRLLEQLSNLINLMKLEEAPTDSN